MNYSLFGAGSQGIYSNTMSVGSLLFFLFDAFGNNAFSSAIISARETLVLDHKILCRVLFLHMGKTPLKNPGIRGKYQSPRQGC
jgi:hypothetical protein